MTSQLLDNDLIAQIRYAPPACVAPNITLEELLRDMQSQRRGAVIVCENEKIVGIVTERDLVRLLSVRTKLDTPISQLMTRSPTTIHLNQTVGDAIEVMSRGGYRRLPVVDEQGAPVGTVKVSHILRYVVEHFPRIVYNLPPKPHLKTHEREGA
jgi:CBS domain-containing protein